MVLPGRYLNSVEIVRISGSYTGIDELSAGGSLSAVFAFSAFCHWYLRFWIRCENYRRFCLWYRRSVDVQPARQGLSLRFQFLPLVLTRCQLQRSTCIPHGSDRCAGGPVITEELWKQPHEGSGAWESIHLGHLVFFRILFQLSWLSFV